MHIIKHEFYIHLVCSVSRVDYYYSAAFLGHRNICVGDGGVIHHGYDCYVNVDSDHKQISEASKGEKGHYEPCRQTI